MKAVYVDSGIVEKEAKKRFCFPENIMMENAAAALETQVLLKKTDSVLILCGTGNNGGDGYALARRIFGKVNSVEVLSFGEPKTEEAKVQEKMCRLAGLKIWQFDDFEKIRGKGFSVIVDCIFGTGFHGEMPENVWSVVEWANGRECYRLACDIPSGLKFLASKTVTMGALKSILFKDKAKDYCGEIVTADLGISQQVFESCGTPDAFLVEESDIKLPKREKKSSHKGDFGHVAVILGEKPGAGIIAGTAALKFGAGLVTVVVSSDFNGNYLMNPELMTDAKMPGKTSSVLLGSGLGRDKESQEKSEKVIEYICKMEKPSAVLDADFFYSEKLCDFLTRLNDIPGGRFILTPHPKELYEILVRTGFFSSPEGSEISFSDFCEKRLEYGKKFAEKYPNLVLVSKGANTYIYSGGNIFICSNGTNVLSKAGSGDVLAGMCAALLAQGYEALEAAKTSVFWHGKAGSKFENNWECSPLALINFL